MTLPDRDEWHAEYERLTKALRTHPGTQADKLIHDVQRAFRTWFQRSRELQALLQHGEHDENMVLELIQNVRPPIARDQYISALDSALSAYLGAMGALIDVARRVAQKLPESFQKDYASRVQAVTSLDGVVVLRDLRNYMLHYGSAPWVFNVSFQADQMTSQVSLGSVTLAEWDGWKSDSRAYLRAHEVVHLSAIVTPYEPAMVNLFDWFGEEFYKHKQADIDGANDLVRQVNLHMTGGVSDGKDWQKRAAHMAENMRRMQAGEPQTDYETGKPLPDPK